MKEKKEEYIMNYPEWTRKGYRPGLLPPIWLARLRSGWPAIQSFGCKQSQKEIFQGEERYSAGPEVLRNSLIEDGSRLRGHGNCPRVW